MDTVYHNMHLYYEILEIADARAFQLVKCQIIKFFLFVFHLLEYCEIIFPAPKQFLTVISLACYTVTGLNPFQVYS